MRRENFRRLLTERILVSDGAMGTMLQAEEALPPGGCPDVLNLHRPSLVRQIHEQYLAAGCDMIQTNTFGANRLKLADSGLHTRVQEINLRGRK